MVGSKKKTVKTLNFHCFTPWYFNEYWFYGRNMHATVNYRASSFHRRITSLYWGTRNIFNFNISTLISYFEGQLLRVVGRGRFLLQQLLRNMCRNCRNWLTYQLCLHRHNSMNNSPNDFIQKRQESAEPQQSSEKNKYIFIKGKYGGVVFFYCPTTPQYQEIRRKIWSVVIFSDYMEPR